MVKHLDLIQKLITSKLGVRKTPVCEIYILKDHLIVSTGLGSFPWYSGLSVCSLSQVHSPFNHYPQHLGLDCSE